VPIGAVGFLARDFIDQVLQDSPPLVAVTLILGGIVFIVFEYFWSRTRAKTVSDEALYDVTYGQALFIGVVQVIALVPGVSRAAASIFGGMVAGLDRATATKFSFYLAIPTLGIATVFKLLISMSGLQGSDYVYLLIGAIISGIIAWFAIGWLLRYVAQHTFTSFGYYRIAAGIVILLLVAAAFI
jgi:undecaprenyl-diphosphatase